MPLEKWIAATNGNGQKSPSSKAAALLARGAYSQYVSTAKGRERRWRLFSTFPFIIHERNSVAIDTRLGNHSMTTTSPHINIVILGAGKGGTALLESFLQLPRICLMGIDDKNPEALGIQMARFHNIPTTQNPLELIQKPDVHLIIDVTGDPTLPSLIQRNKHRDTEVLGGAGAKLLWDLVQHESTIQAQLFQAEKLAGMGIFASGIAHDINNPLYVILAFAENILQETDPTIIHDHAQSILQAAKSIQNISQEITHYARASKVHDAMKIEITSQIEEALTIAKYATAAQDLTIEKHLDGLMEIFAKPEEILQIFVNLITNAIHAIEGKGRLTLASWCEDGINKVSISDTGCGIPPENLQKIFVPFFTTKPEGKGTGLGLYNVRTIVRKYNGELTVESSVGKGTTFQLAFPRIS
jgi:signal transduction histidine kinase